MRVSSCQQGRRTFTTFFSFHHLFIPSTFFQHQTRQSEWATVYSRWRYLHGYLFAVGPPHHLLRRIKVPLIINSIVFGIVAADHIVESVSTSSGKGSINLFPKLSASVVANLTPIFQLSLLAVSLMLTQRVGRVYDRWLEVREMKEGVVKWWCVYYGKRTRRRTHTRTPTSRHPQPFFSTVAQKLIPRLQLGRHRLPTRRRVGRPQARRRGRAVGRGVDVADGRLVER